MPHADDFESIRKYNDALHDELIAASHRTEVLVEASDELFQRRERVRARLARVEVSAPISQDLGKVQVMADGRIAIDLDPSRLAVCDKSQLGARILEALDRAEKKLEALIEAVFSETTASHGSRRIPRNARSPMSKGSR